MARAFFTQARARKETPKAKKQVGGGKEVEVEEGEEEEEEEEAREQAAPNACTTKRWLKSRKETPKIHEAPTHTCGRRRGERGKRGKRWGEVGEGSVDDECTRELSARCASVGLFGGLLGVRARIKSHPSGGYGRVHTMRTHWLKLCASHSKPDTGAKQGCWRLPKKEGPASCRFFFCHTTTNKAQERQ